MQTSAVARAGACGYGLNDAPEEPPKVRTEPSRLTGSAGAGVVRRDVAIEANRWCASVGKQTSEAARRRRLRLRVKRCAGGASQSSNRTLTSDRLRRRRRCPPGRGNRSEPVACVGWQADICGSTRRRLRLRVKRCAGGASQSSNRTLTSDRLRRRRRCPPGAVIEANRWCASVGMQTSAVAPRRRLRLRVKRCAGGGLPKFEPNPHV
ncbi:hypothetical protein UC8_11830 [Roseimaritima ulvae]|uniref:Uncharacterized protein n=1 Tax=Roseimaritima ulvae TaxID=980254 RepID=A0A5B9QMX7_9BACT|nr:hypothetical protein UC8_11830 [Roseimaritima ulvae]